jgi:hypothetical protein
VPDFSRPPKSRGGDNPPQPERKPIPLRRNEYLPVLEGSREVFRHLFAWSVKEENNTLLKIQ